MSEITQPDASYALDLVKRICKQVGPGSPGSPQECERARIIKNELESHLGAGQVVMEEFAFAPDASLSGWPAVFLIMAVLLNLFIGQTPGVSPLLTAILALVFSIIGPVVFVFEFILGYELIDPIFPKKLSVNVIGTLRRSGTQTAKHLLILSGHHDSALENPWIRFLGYGFFAFSSISLLGMLVLPMAAVVQLVGVISGDAALVKFGTLGWVSLVFLIVPSILFGLFPNWHKKDGGSVPGAADNLSACALTVSMCRFLVNNPSLIPEDTEIRFISFGSEEAGLRGSRRYVERHLEELKNMDARLLNYETVVHPEIGILTSDMNGTLKYSPEVVDGVVSAAERAGVPHRVKAASLGVITDAVPFCRAGLKAATLLPFKVPEQMIAFYHQETDTPDVLTIDPFINVLKLSLEWIRACGRQN